MYSRQDNKVFKTKLIHLNSYDFPSQFEDVSKSAITAVLQKPIQNAQSIRLVNYSLPFTWYNINSNNNTLVFSVGSPLTTATQINNYSSKLIIPSGHWSYLTLKKYMQTQMETLIPNGWGITFDSTVNKFTITGTTSFNIYSSYSTIAPVIGLGSSTLSGATITLPNPVNFLFASQILLHSDQVSSISGRSASDTILSVINFHDYTFGSVISNQDGVLYSAYPVRNKDISQLTFWFTNEKYQGIFLNGYEFSLSLEISYLE